MHKDPGFACGLYECSASTLWPASMVLEAVHRHGEHPAWEVVRWQGGQLESSLGMHPKSDPLVLALGKVTYARYLLAQMTQLEQECPAMYQHLQRGNFCVTQTLASHLGESQWTKLQKKQSTTTHKLQDGQKASASHLGQCRTTT